MPRKIYLSVYITDTQTRFRS